MDKTHEAQLVLEDVDRDGAIRETFAEARDAVEGGHTRSSFLGRAGAVMGGGLLIGALPVGLANAQGGGLGKGDLKILNYALTLEYLEAAFYAEAVSKGKLSGRVAKFAQTVGAHEAAHVRALKGTLGAKAVKKPTFDFKGTTGATGTFLSTSKVLEDTGVSAYQGQAPRIKAGAVLAAAGSILAVEARHASWVAFLIGEGRSPSPAPNAFSPAKSMSQVLSAVTATGFIK
jgi:Ferritin-like domain